MEEAEETEMDFLNRSYTNYMLSVSQKGGYEEVVAALLSCAWTYAEIANGIDERNPKAKDHPFYGEWILGYTSKEFQEGAQKYIKQMDEIGKYLSPERKEYLKEVFRVCCLYELKFWDMAYFEGSEGER